MDTSHIMGDIYLNGNDTFNVPFPKRLKGKVIQADSCCSKQAQASEKNEIHLDDSVFLSESFNSAIAVLESATAETDTKGEVSSVGQVDNGQSEAKSKEDHAAIIDVFGKTESNTPSVLEVSKSCNNLEVNIICNDVSQPPSSKVIGSRSQKSETLHGSIEHKYIQSLSSWGLPERILQKYYDKKVKDMFPWQVECLSHQKVMEDYSNLVYSAPTSAGKTLIAEMLSIKTILERKRKVIFILPFVSVVREKMFYFQDILGSSGIRVDGFMGSYSPPGGFRNIQLAICTIEKANSLVNRLLEEGCLSQIGAVVIDEIHLLGDPHRGYLLELLLTKLLYMCTAKSIPKIQIIGMSATLPNLEILAKWLDAELYTTSFRPIPLYEQIQINSDILDSNLQLVRKLQKLPGLEIDTDNILQLCLETIGDGCSVLIFCPTKNWCENLAQQISSAFCLLCNSKTTLGEMLHEQLNSSAIKELLEQLKRCPVGLDKIIEKTVSFAVAFHHAGLTIDERDIIEGAFHSGALRVLVATSTLSSGVNLPARRVIIRTPLFHGKPIDALSYHQMIGRAGRMGRDTEGESILICQKNEFYIVKQLMSSELKPIESCLEDSGRLKRALLEVIASGVVSTPDEVNLFTSCTLLALNADKNSNDLCDPISESVEFLKRNEFIRMQMVSDNSSKYIATSLGKACLSSSLPPEEGLALFTELEKARRCIVLETELHLIYLVTPFSASNQLGNLDWMLFLDMWERLPASMKRVGELIGISEGYIVNAARSKIQTNTSKLYHKLMIHKRFYTALALQDLVNEVPLHKVARKFKCSRGVLQSLQQSASTFAGMVTTFSRQLGWSSIEILISQFQDRMLFGVNRQLLDLMKLPILNGVLARALYNAGIETLVDLAAADACILENILYKTAPFESERVREGESEYDCKQRSKMKYVWVMGKQGLNEKDAAVMFIQEAQKYIRLEMGLVNAKWHENSVEESISAIRDTSNAAEGSKTNCDTSSLTSEALSNTSFDLHLSPCSKTDFEKLSNDSLSDESLFEDSSNEKHDAFENSFSFRETYNNVRITENLTNAKKTINYENNNYESEGESDVEPFNKRFKMAKFSTSITNNHQSFTNIDFKSMEVINVCENKMLFETFFEELQSRSSLSISVACEEVDKNADTIGIKRNSLPKKSPKKFEYKNIAVKGIAINWGGSVAYYISLNSDTAVSKHRILCLLRELLGPRKTLRIFDCKEQLKLLQLCCGIICKSQVNDPKILDWIHEPEEKEKNLQAMALKYCPSATQLSQLTGKCRGVGSVGIDLFSSVDSKLRACIESIVTWHLIDPARDNLINQDPRLLQASELEMKTLVILADMEVSGIGVAPDALQILADDLKLLQSNLECDAFSIAGRRFLFTSSTDVAKAVGIYRGRKTNTNKKVLEKIDNPLSHIVLQWRKVNSILTKMVYPLLQLVTNNRIHGRFITHTSTGRITMHEPNLQTIPRSFEVYTSLKKEPITVNCRKVFVASNNYLLLSADYCQLELRLLAHLSRDTLLCSVMKSGEDVFKSIAAKWNGIAEQEVTDILRQRAKQICYGIIYGMGLKTLSEQLAVPEEDAVEFLESFHNKYPGIKKYIETIIEECKKNGFVETITGRRRYLHNINNEILAIKSQATRQAVNTRIQGSAADVAKSAMYMIACYVEDKYQSAEDRPKLVLQLHDELLYEVPVKHANDMANIIKQCMEGSVKLSIPFPVKLKSGYSWGTMNDLVL